MGFSLECTRQRPIHFTHRCSLAKSQVDNQTKDSFCGRQARLHWAKPHTFLSMPHATPCFMVSDFITVDLKPCSFFNFFTSISHSVNGVMLVMTFVFLWPLLGHFYDFFSYDQVIKMLDDHGVSSDGIAVYEVAYQVRRSISDNSQTITSSRIHRSMTGG